MIQTEIECEQRAALIHAHRASAEVHAIRTHRRAARERYRVTKIHTPETNTKIARVQFSAPNGTFPEYILRFNFVAIKEEKISLFRKCSTVAIGCNRFKKLVYLSSGRLLKKKEKVLLKTKNLGQSVHREDLRN